MNYLQEWQQSCVDEQLIRLNVTSLTGASPSEYLLYAEDLPRRNDGRVSNAILQRYNHIEAGGWWCSGVDLLTGEADLWGCFKPDVPRIHPEKGKLIKYEHPPQAPTGLFALRVPLHLWERIAERAHIPILPASIDPEQPDFGFWQWLMKHPEVPLCITEGAKKAGALLSAGYAAIALPGVHNGYRTPKDETGKRIGNSYLIPPLKKLANPKREIYIAFDQDSKPTTIKAVNSAIKRLGYLFQKANCAVKIITWDNQLGKGVDDLIAQQGEETFTQAYETALPFEIWKARELNQLTYSPNLVVNARYLPQLAINPEAQLIGIKSPKGTGKTEYLKSLVSQALAQHQPVIVIGHRVRLVEELCQRFGLPHIREIRDNPLGQVLGYGLCIDSLHPQSQCQFNPEQWADSLVIIDEVEQVLWHALNSDTCRHQRVAILKTLKSLLQTVLSSHGRVVVSDADLSDVSLDYLIALAGIPLDPFVVHNHWKAQDKDAWTVYHYPENDPKRLVKHLVQHIREGGKPFVCLSAQKLTSSWGTLNLESYLNKQFPQAKILRIDAESLTDSSHPAYGCMGNLNEVLAKYDVVLASPSIETGVSIDLKGHFTSVWCIAQGVQTATSVCQALGRVRENVPRYLWAAGYGFNKVGNGSTSIPALLTSGHRLTELNIRLLHQSDLENLDDLDIGFQGESLFCWAKMAVRVNVSMVHYRDSVLAHLQQENHRLELRLPNASLKTVEENQNSSPESSSSSHQLSDAIKEVQAQNYQAECQAIALSPLLSDQHYQSLKKRLVKNSEERRAIRKYELQQRYGIPITPELIHLDDQGWYQKLRLHYFLTIGRPYLADRDTQLAKKLIEQGHGSLFLPDFNGSQLGAIIGTMDILGIPVLLANPHRELCPLDSDLVALAKIAIQNRADIKTVVGIGIAQNASPITIIRRFLDEIGFGLNPLKSKRVNKKSVRVYQMVCPQDQREAVFEQWLIRDRALPGSSEGWFDEYWLKLRLSEQKHRSKTAPYVQLSLDLS
ncbi:MAG: plasmid replication protein, CyRepA1 family [Snowella sp.]|nr:plasmid replication protein, CyRepA1 family [Snowella sp.]